MAKTERSQTLVEYECCDCGINFTAKWHNKRKRCDSCGVTARVMMMRESRTRYNKTNAGLMTLAEQAARRRSEDPTSFGLRVLVMHRENERCSWCGRLATVIDHVLPIAMGRLLQIVGLDHWRNLNPMCVDCHLEKTKMDISDIHRMKKELVA